MNVGLTTIALGLSVLAGIAAPTIAQTLAQAEPFSMDQHCGGRMQALGLTDEQREEMRAIAQEGHQEMLSVLTDEQRQQFETLAQQAGGRFRPGAEANPDEMPSPDGDGSFHRGGRGGMRGVFSSLNLTDEQQERIREIRQETHERMQSVLTPDQQQQLEDMRQNHRRPL